MNKKLKIAVVVKSFNLSGGMERYAVAVAQGLTQKGHQVDIVTREADATLLLPGMRCLWLPKRLSFSSVLSAMALAADAAKILAEKEYDIIHSHERGYSQNVLTCHCFSFKGSLRSYPFLRWFDQTFLSPRGWLYLFLEARQMQTRRVVAVSTAIKNDIADTYDRVGRVSVIEPGVDGEKFHPEAVQKRRNAMRQELSIPPDHKVVLFVGSEFKRKGMDILIPAIETEGLYLLAVGRGDSLDRYKRLAVECGVSKRVHFAGLCEDVLHYYAAADLVVLPSQSEAFGMSVLEGMSCGLPVVVTPNVGAASLITHGVNGYIVEQSGLVAFFLNLPEQQTLRKVGAAARQTAVNHQWQNVVNQYEKLFYEIASESI